MKNIIQSVLLPSLEIGAQDDMYIRRINENVHLLLSEKKAIFNLGGEATFDTYFNGLTVTTWKEKCSISQLALALKGKGRFLLRVGLHKLSSESRWLDEQVITFDENENCTLSITSWNDIDTGMLFFSLEALTEGEITGGYFYTDDVPLNKVRLGIVVTHYNRKQWVLPAIKRVQNELLTDPGYSDNVALVIVDNSQNISQEEIGDSSGITLIPNENYGGSGGFTRGLLHLTEENNFTHCLFMDDDASCEIDSIKRAIALLAYARDGEMTIAGAYLRFLEKYSLIEKGARFAGHVMPLKRVSASKKRYDLRNVHDLLCAEVNDGIQPNYGAWWFFAFALNTVTHYPFPFFVRGDDIAFSLANNFKITTLNGISCWGDDFSLKHNPVMAYLDMRYHLVNSMVYLNMSKKNAVKMVCKHVMQQLLSYNYEHAQAGVLAVQHVMKGASFFVENMDMSAVRAEINSFVKDEVMKPISREYVIGYRELQNEGRLRYYLRMITLNGFLLPKFFLKKTTVFQRRAYCANFKEIFLCEKVSYEYGVSRLGYVASHDKKRFFSIVLKFAKLILKLSHDYEKIKQNYITDVPKITNKNFWQDVYRK